MSWISFATLVLNATKFIILKRLEVLVPHSLLIDRSMDKSSSQINNNILHWHKTFHLYLSSLHLYYSRDWVVGTTCVAVIQDKWRSSGGCHWQREHSTINQSFGKSLSLALALAFTSLEFNLYAFLLRYIIYLYHSCSACLTAMRGLWVWVMMRVGLFLSPRLVCLPEMS